MKEVHALIALGLFEAPLLKALMKDIIPYVVDLKSSIERAMKEENVLGVQQDSGRVSGLLHYYRHIEFVVKICIAHATHFGINTHDCHKNDE